MRPDEEEFDPYRVAEAQDAAVDEAAMPPVPEEPLAPVDPVVANETRVADVVPELATPPAPKPEAPAAEGPSKLDQFVSFLKGKAGRAPTSPEEIARGDNVSEALYSAFTRRPLNPGHFNRSTQVALQNQQIEAAKAKALAPKTNKALITPADLAAQKAFIGAFPDLARRMGHEAISGMTADQLKSYITAQGNESRITAQSARQQSAQEFAAEQAQLRRDAAKQALAVNQQLSARRDARISSQDQSSKLFQYSTTKLNEENAVHGALQNFYREIGALPGDLANPEAAQAFSNFASAASRVPWGFGNAVYDRLTSPDPQARAYQARVQMAYRKLRNAVIKSTAGKAITDAELNLVLEEFRDRAFDNPQDTMAQVEMLRKATGNSLLNKEAGVRMVVNPETFKAFGRVGGLTTYNPMYYDVVPEDVRQALDAMGAETPAGMSPTMANTYPGTANTVDSILGEGGYPTAPAPMATKQTPEPRAPRRPPPTAVNTPPPTSIPVREPASGVVDSAIDVGRGLLKKGADVLAAPAAKVKVVNENGVPGSVAADKVDAWLPKNPKRRRQ